MPDIVVAAEVIAKGIQVGARYFSDTMGAIGSAFAEQRKAFDDDEAGDYLRCAGADALADCNLMTSTVCDIPQSPVDEPAGVDASRQASPGGSPLSDAELFSAAADVIDTWIPADTMGGSGARWLAAFVDILRDRAAQFGAVDYPFPDAKLFDPSLVRPLTAFLTHNPPQ